MLAKIGKEAEIYVILAVFVGMPALIIGSWVVASLIYQAFHRNPGRAKSATSKSQAQQVGVVPQGQAAALAVLSPSAELPENIDKWEIAVVVECVRPPVVPLGDAFLNARGWTYSDFVYHGRFTTSFGSWKGEIRCRDGDCFPYIKSPPRCLFTGHHINCIMRRDNGWYLIHLQKSLGDAVNTVIAIEAFISKKFQSMI